MKSDSTILSISSCDFTNDTFPVVVTLFILSQTKPCFYVMIGAHRRCFLYEKMLIPYEKLKSLPDVDQHLKVGRINEKLNALESQYSDNEVVGSFQTTGRISLNRLNLKLFS